MPLDCPEVWPEKEPVVVVFKAEFRLAVYDGGRLRDAEGRPACFPIALGGEPAGDKAQRGDERTPEGVLRITHKNPQSSFHLSLGLNYPAARHADAGFRAGIIDAATRDRVRAADAPGRMPVRSSALGGDIYIHGGGTSSPNWTDGCVALENTDMDWLYAEAKSGMRVVVLP